MRSVVLAMALVAAGCGGGGGGQTQWCSPESCSGCCDGDNCVPGDAAGACGLNGNACSDCLASGQTCGATGSCEGGAGGGTGGGSAGGGAGGGSAGGGSGGGSGGGAGGGAGGGGTGGGGGGVTCNVPLLACDGACIDPKTDPAHCGTCATVCSGGSACSNGQCQTLPTDCTAAPCPALGYYCDLGSKQCKAGCVLDTQCGGQLNKCDTASRTCGCQLGSCGTASYCTAARTCAAGCEQHSQCGGQTNTCNLPTHACVCSPNSCPAGSFCGGDGSCKTGCGSNAQCTKSNENTCNPSSHVCECNSGFHKCGGACVSNASINSCGSSCTPCAAAPAHATAQCASNACSVKCDDGYFMVGGACYPVQSTNATYSAGQEIRCSIDYVSNSSQCSTFISSQLPDLVYLVGDYNVICALSKTGPVYCAGRSNYSGELGVGMTPSASGTFLPLPNLPMNVVKLGLNAKRGFALTATGELWRWGNGWQTNTGSNPWAVAPAWTPVLYRSGIKDFAVGEDEVCLVERADPGSIDCFGGYSGSNGYYMATYFQAPAGVAIEKISYAYDHGCAIDTLGKVYCWGQADWGQLGYTTTSISDQPVLPVPSFPPAGKKAVAVAVTSFGNSCAVLDSGELYCWGHMGSNTMAKPVPQLMTNYSDLTNVGANRQVICPTYDGATGCFDP